MQTISFVDLEGARRNYRAELEGQSFDSVRAKAEALWNKSLGCMEIEGGTRDILSGAYQNCVEGLCGNEDVGQMSAWYVLTAAGIHQLCPGDTRFEITSPLFSKLTIHLDPAYAKGHTFVIKTIGGSSRNIYIKRMRLNGKPYNKTYIDYSDIMAGGTLEMEMSAK